jgi:tetratricopeptide (TPR) repeat protein
MRIAGHCDSGRISRRLRGDIAVGRAGGPLVVGLLLLCVVCYSPLRAQVRHEQSSTEARQIESLMQQGRLDEARARAEEFLQGNPRSTDGYNLLGMILAQQQDFTGAAASFQKALAIDPESVRTHNNLGNLYLIEKKPDLAEREFGSVLRRDPDNRAANYNLGVLLMVKSDPAGAIEHFRRVQPADPSTRLQLVRAYFDNKQSSLALQAATQLSSVAKNDVQVHFSLGVLLGTEKKYKAAQLELEKADALQPGTFEILYNLGQDLLRSGESTQAEPVLTRALRIRPDSADALYLMGRVLANESRPLDALDVLVRARKLDPKNVDILFLMAQISMSQNYFEDAIPVLEDGLKIAPRRPELVAALGESYFMAGKSDKAIATFEQLVAIEHSARSYAFLGMSYRNLGRFDEAKRNFELGLGLDPKNSLCLYNMGYIAERQGDAAAAEKYFQRALQYAPNFADPILELANLRIAAKRPQEAEELLRRYVRVSHDPATGYYKLAMVERSLHEMDAANRDLAVFKTLSTQSSSGPYPYQHLFDYLADRSRLPLQARQRLDVQQVAEEATQHPDQPENLYFLAETYLKAGQIDNALQVIAHLDQVAQGDYRMFTGVGVLMARYRLFDGAIEHLKIALQANVNVDQIRFDLADTYFRAHHYQEALDTALQVSPDGRKDEAWLALLADTYAHLGQVVRASAMYRDAITRNPDNDQDYLSLALIQLRAGDTDAARQTLNSGRARVPGSGKLYWGLGVVSALQGRNGEAADDLERAVDLLPEWPGAYSALGVFYFENGEVAKAREVFERFRSSDASGSLSRDQIERALDTAADSGNAPRHTMDAQARAQFLQWALLLADRTL